MTKHQTTKHPKALYMKIWYKIWHDKDGKIVLVQTPNIWLYGWLVGKIFGFLVGEHTGRSIALIGSISLFAWAVLEVASGVNYFRRILGTIIGVFTLLGIIKAF